jgi:hypothetical protein
MAYFFFVGELGEESLGGRQNPGSMLEPADEKKVSIRKVR